MKTLLLLCTIFPAFFCFSSKVLAQSWVWAKTPFNEYTLITDVSSDAQGNLYITGLTYNINIYELPNFYVAKLSASGNLICKP